jgi:hypothetical protein
LGLLPNYAEDEVEMVDNLLFRAILYILAYLVALWGGHHFTRLFLKNLGPPGDSGIERAGALIGYLERTFVLTFVLLNQFVAIAIVLTAKSITRFEELKDRKFAEYYLVGTLASMLFATLTGVLVRLILSQT